MRTCPSGIDLIRLAGSAPSPKEKAKDIWKSTVPAQKVKALRRPMHDDLDAETMPKKFLRRAWSDDVPKRKAIDITPKCNIHGFKILYKTTF